MREVCLNLNYRQSNIYINFNYSIRFSLFLLCRNSFTVISVRRGSLSSNFTESIPKFLPAVLKSSFWHLKDGFNLAFQLEVLSCEWHQGEK